MLGEQDDVLDWLARINVEELDLLDKLRIVIAFENFIDDVQPIMEKQLEESIKSTGIHSLIIGKLFLKIT